MAKKSKLVINSGGGEQGHEHLMEGAFGSAARAAQQHTDAVEIIGLINRTIRQLEAEGMTVDLGDARTIGDVVEAVEKVIAEKKLQDAKTVDSGEIQLQ